jgi:hypothetical protein
MGIITWIKEKIRTNQERKEFLKVVEEETKPIRRKGYLLQKKADALREGMELAKEEALKKKKKTSTDFGINQTKTDYTLNPFKYIRSEKEVDNNGRETI